MLTVHAMGGVEVSQQMALAPRLALRPSPLLVASTTMLALPSLELEQAVERELAENPALERVDCVSCNRCGRPLLNERCPHCERPRRTAPQHGGPQIAEAAAVPAPAETILREVAPLLREGDRAIAIYLLGSLDERGFLDTTADEVAAALAVTPERVTCVLRLVQETAPAGVAARDVRECLLLQLDRLREDDPVKTLARRIVDSHLPLLGRGLYGALARALAVERADVLAARDFIRSRLRPYPEFGAARSEIAPPLVPDVLVSETEDGLAVDLTEPERFRLVISPAYERAAGARLSPDERETVRRQLETARAFIDRLEQRWNTMRAVAELVIEQQHAFVRHGPRHLVPLTRVEVAESLGVHESTVSRAVAGRNVALPSGRVVPLANLFDAAGAPRDALAELLANEERPKSDAELADDLANLGFVLARRTVAKYRERLGVLPSALR
jgi:RNA polymerase sigma-54 factor